MEQQAVFQKVVEILSRYIKDASLLAQADGSTRIVEDLDVNSARLVDVVLALEDEFDVEVDDATVNAIRTIDDAVEVIRRQLGGK